MVLIFLPTYYSSCLLEFGYGNSSNLGVLEQQFSVPKGTLSADIDDVGIQIQGHVMP